MNIGKVLSPPSLYFNGGVPYIFVYSGKVDFRTGTGRKASFEFSWPDSGPLVHMFLQQRKANSLVPAIFSPLHRFFRKGGGGDWDWYTSLFSLILLLLSLSCAIGSATIG